MSDLQRARYSFPRAVALTVLVGAVLVVPARAATGTFTKYTFANGPTYTRDYWLYVPSTYTTSSRVPLVIALHGCTQTGDDFARGSKFNAYAEEKRFLIAYPEERTGNYPSGNPTRCWNDYFPMDQHRGSGEFDTVAKITQYLKSAYRVDPRRVYLYGLSSGAIMAGGMGAAYPDIYAAIGSFAGCAYPDCTSSGLPAYQEMGPRARVLPVIVGGGDADPTLPGHAEVVQQWLDTNDFADDGANNASISRAPASVENRSADPGEGNGYPYTIQHFEAGAQSCSLIDHYTIHGLGHAWPYGDPSGSFTDPKGPDTRKAIYAFFMEHPMQRSGVVVDSCAAPVAVEDAAHVAQQSPTSIPVLANDVDADGDPLKVLAVTQPAGGSVTIDSGAGSVTFTASPGFVGNTSFTYTAGDGESVLDTSNGGTSTATVKAFVNHPPALASIGNRSGEEMRTLLIPVSASDLDGGTLTIQGSAVPGMTYAATGNGAGTFTWRPTSSQSGTWPLTVTVTDAVGDSTSEQLTITIADLPRKAVDANGLEFPSVQEALSGGAGSVVRVLPGTHAESLSVSRAVTICGSLDGLACITDRGAAAPVVLGALRGPTLRILTAGVVVQGLTFDGYDTGVAIASSNATVSQVRFGRGNLGVEVAGVNGALMRQSRCALETTICVAFASGVTGRTVDARLNDWSVYADPLVERRVNASGNTVLQKPFLLS